eukprot:12037399-Alexandrium_andersonii.AAC.1
MASIDNATMLTAASAGLHLQCAQGYTCCATNGNRCAASAHGLRLALPMRHMHRAVTCARPRPEARRDERRSQSDHRAPEDRPRQGRSRRASNQTIVPRPRPDSVAPTEKLTAASAGLHLHDAQGYTCCVTGARCPEACSLGLRP